MNIRHQTIEQKFIGDVDGMQVLLEYQRTDSTVNFTHTYVPLSLRSKGYGR